MESAFTLGAPRWVITGACAVPECGDANIAASTTTAARTPDRLIGFVLEGGRARVRDPCREFVQDVIVPSGPWVAVAGRSLSAVDTNGHRAKYREHPAAVQGRLRGGFGGKNDESRVRVAAPHRCPFTDAPL